MGLRSGAAAAWRRLVRNESGWSERRGSYAEIMAGWRRPARSGKSVTRESMLEVPTILAIARVLCDGVAQVPWKLFRDPGTGAQPATEHPLYPVLYRQPNPWQTSFRFRETMMLHLVLCGNFFAFINRVGPRGDIAELIPFEPGQVKVERKPDGRLTYEIRLGDGASKVFPQESILHLRGLSWDSWSGLEPVRLARETIGLTMAIQDDQADLYRNGLRTSGTYSVDGTLGPEAYAELRAFITDFRKENPGAPLILDRAAKYVAETMTAVDAQTLEMRRLQVEENCRPFRVMPIMIGHADKTATYASAEQMFLAHVTHTMLPWYERLQQDTDVQLLNRAADRGVYSKFVVNALMRGTAEARANYYATALGAGGAPAFMTQNEVRALEELPPLPGGDVLHAPTSPPAPKTKTGADNPPQKANAS
jgi:HK97 family phage portal protein